MTDAVKPDTSEAAVERAAQGLEFVEARLDLSSAETQRICVQNLAAGAATLRTLLAERDAALSARDDAIRRLGDAARDAGRWRGISEGKDIATKQLEAERDALRAQLADVLAENDAVRFQLNNANATLREAGHE